jgi:hypothetical protein
MHGRATQQRSVIYESVALILEVHQGRGATTHAMGRLELGEAQDPRTIWVRTSSVSAPAVPELNAD